MHADDAAETLHLAQGVEHGLIADHHRGIGHVHFEGGDALVEHLGQLGADAVVPVVDGHVEAVVAAGLPVRLLMPAGKAGVADGLDAFAVDEQIGFPAAGSADDHAAFQQLFHTNPLLFVDSATPHHSSSAFGGYFSPVHRFGKFDVHKARPHFPNLASTKNLSPDALAE